METLKVQMNNNKSIKFDYQQPVEEIPGKQVNSSNF